MEQWTPGKSGADFEFTPILQPLEPFRDSLVVVSNLTRAATQGGDHAVSAAGWLTGAAAKRTEAEDILAGITIDQVVAKKIGQDNPFPSLELATEDFTGYIGACTTGFSCAYANTISWSSPTTPLPMEINPRVVFERLFGEPGSAAQRTGPHPARSQHPRFRHARSQRPAERARHARPRAARSVSRQHPRDRAPDSAHRSAQQRQVTTVDAPIGIPESFEEHMGLMYDLLAVAYEADLTRVFTFMAAREISARTYPQAGVPEQHHQVSHHGNDPDKIAKTAKINTYHSALFAKFLQKLRSTPDGDGSLLDHSLIVYGGGMGNPNQHAASPLPLVAVGGGAGKGNRHLLNKAGTPVGNMWLSVANQFGSPLESFGLSNGRVDLF